MKEKKEHKLETTHQQTGPTKVKEKNKTNKRNQKKTKKPRTCDSGL